MRAENFIYRNNARKRSTTVILALVIATLFGAWVWLAAHWLVILPIAFCVALAVADWMRNPKYVAELSGDAMTWTTGTDITTFELARVNYVAMSTRLDFSTRVTFHTLDGEKIRMHPACTPPASVFKSELERRGIKVEQKHFTFVS